MSRLCQEFGCVPSVAVHEWVTSPVGLLEAILEYRAFAQAAHLIDHAKKASDIPDHPMVDLVHEIDSLIYYEDVKPDV